VTLKVFFGVIRRIESEGKKMIEGAEILKKTELFNSEPSKLTMAIGIIGIILIISILICALTLTSTKKKFASIMGVFIIAIIGIAVLPKTYEEVSAGYQYDVYAGGSDVIKTLYEKYEIIEANGNIYTVREKTETEE